MKDRIELLAIPISCRVGVPDEERATPQPLFVDLELFFDMTPAAATDNVAATVNYVEVCDTVDACLHGRDFKLIETIAVSLANAILTQFPRVDELSVRIRKPLALANRGITHTAVLIHRRRHE